MIRVKDKDVSLKFYEEIMGMTFLRSSENESAGFNLYFLGYGGKPKSDDSVNGVNPVANREGVSTDQSQRSARAITEKRSCQTIFAPFQNRQK